MPLSANMKGRTWDKVDVANGVIAPPYSRPPSAAVGGPSDRELLTKVKPLSRSRPASDTALNGYSKACSIM